MAITVPPLPASMRNSPEILAWYAELVKNIPGAGSITWTSVDKTGSALADLVSRPHSALTSILEADPASADATRNKHVASNDLKLAADDRVVTAAHRAATSAHGATGDVVGVGDTATDAVAGVVLQGAAVADANAVGATYSQAEVQNIVDQFNALLAALRTAGSIAT